MQLVQSIFHYKKMADEVGGFGEVELLGRAAQIEWDKTANHAHVSPSLFASFTILPRRVWPCRPSMRNRRTSDTATNILTNNVNSTPNRSHKVINGVWNRSLSRPIFEIQSEGQYEYQYTESGSIKLRLAVMIGASLTYTIPCDNRSGIISGFSPAYESATAHDRTCALGWLVREEVF
jgi:hypothetical protein